MIVNPVLKGFNPDPSIIRVENDYYIATSTFEWFPGVQIHHSTDLVNWELITHPLNRISQLDLKGVPNSGGVWAPCLSYDNGTYYLVYSNSRSWTGVYKDVDNFLVTAKDIRGPWSEPTYISSAGFDASLFHDPNTGKKWYSCVNWDYRKSSEGNSVECFDGIILQEFDEKQGKLVGEVTNIFPGTELGLVEAPHIYYINGYYYLMTAEGGTFTEHAVTLCRSKNIDGPYELHPQNPVLTADGDTSIVLQRSGHASLVDTPDGEYYLAHLCGRPHMPEVRCNLGRETSIQKMEFKDDWLYVEGGGNRPFVEVASPNRNTKLKEKETLFLEEFNGDKLSIHFNSLRVPMTDDWALLKDNKLSLKGRESLFSTFDQSTIARRVQDFNVTAETSFTFDTKSHFQSAGLIYHYDTKNHYFLRVTHMEGLGTVCNLLKSDRGAVTVASDSIPVTDTKYTLKLELRQKEIQFFYVDSKGVETAIGEVQDATIISDEYVGTHFTGAFVGMHVEDMNRKETWADFEYFKYEELS